MTAEHLLGCSTLSGREGKNASVRHLNPLTFRVLATPILEHYRKVGHVADIDSSLSIYEVCIGTYFFPVVPVYESVSSSTSTNRSLSAIMHFVRLIVSSVLTDVPFC
ncbi:hypothetical protein BDZ89DRAFT_93587 [Hymenopellis radicata]|nr:hypothetical protein BDZ89DRAFT_93587 [Hymenopellis radicata]